MAIDQGLAQLGSNFIYSAMAVYTVAMVAFAAEWAFGSRSVVGRAAVPVGARAGVGQTGTEAVPDADAGDPAAARESENRADRLGRVGLSLTVLAFGLHFAAVVCRGLAEGRVPWGNMYEFATAASLAATAGFLVLVARSDARWLGVFVVTPVLLTLGAAVTLFYEESAPLRPQLQSYWLAIHVTAAVTSTGAFTVGTVATLLYLYAERYERRHGARVPRLPAAADLDRIAYRVYAFVFPLWTFAIVAGAIWAENAWGRYWGWDPKETWSFITWVVFAAYLHARATAGWKGRAAAMVALAGYLCLLFNFIGVNIWITGLHSYA